MNPNSVLQNLTCFSPYRFQFFHYTLLSTLIYSMTGCAEPFKTDRHDLDSFRILAARVDNGIADAVIWSGEGAYHRESPILRWYHGGELLEEGYAVALPPFDSYDLEVESMAGETLYAEVESGYRLEPISLMREHWYPGDDLSMEERQRIALEDGLKMVPENAAARLTNVSSSDTIQNRWMHDVGSVLELSQSSADFFSQRIDFDGEEFTSEDVDIQIMEVFLLAIDGLGGSTWKWIHLNFTEDVFLQHDEQFIPIPFSQDVGLLAIDVFELTTGYELQNPRFVDDLSAASALECAPTDQPFQLLWLKQGRCSLTELDGQT
ncbi:MAG: hypothetical protein VX278_03415, partial [Myxococcota bacterium]|nr:hypothetical protein [Myxococcota bacterium]